MSRTATVFCGAIVLLGAATFVHTLVGWQSSNPSLLLALLAFAFVAATVKFRVPGVEGTLTASLFLSLLCIELLSASEAMVVGASTAIIQSYWRTAKRPKPIQVLFNVATVTMATVGASHAIRILDVRAAWLGLLPIAVLGGSAYFILNMAPLAAIIQLTEGGTGFSKWRSSYLWTFPFYVAGMCLAGVVNEGVALVGWRAASLVLPVFYVAGRTFQVYVGRLEDSRRHANELEDLQLRSIRALAQAVEAQDDTTHSHLHRVQTYAVEIGKELGLSETELKGLRAAAILHDVGKLAVPEHIISKPGKLTAEEFEKMKMHTVVGGEIVEQLRFPFAVAPMVRGHHEKWDGSGYPDGLAGEAIPIGARILSTVDCFDALVTDRQYRRAMTLEQAIEIVRRESGKAFDPRIVALLDRRYAELEDLARRSSQPLTGPMSALKVMRGEAPDAGLEVSHQSIRGVSDLEKSVRRLRRLVKSRAQITSIIDAFRWVPRETRLANFAGGLSGVLKDVVPHDALVLFERVENRLVARGAAGDDRESLLGLGVPEGQGVSGWVALNRKPILNADPKVEPGMAPDTRLAAVLSAPLVWQESLGGVICLYRRQKDAFSRADLKAVEYLVPRIAEITSDFTPAFGEPATFGPSPAEPMHMISIGLQGLPSPSVGGSSAEAERLMQRCLDLARESLASEAVYERLGRTELGVWIRDVPDQSLGSQLSALHAKLGELSQEGPGGVDPVIEAMTIGPYSTLEQTLSSARSLKQPVTRERPA